MLASSFVNPAALQASSRHLVAAAILPLEAGDAETADAKQNH